MAVIGVSRQVKGVRERDSSLELQAGVALLEQHAALSQAYEELQTVVAEVETMRDELRQQHEVVSARMLPVFELKDRFIYNLLHGRIQSEGAILRDAKLLGMDFTPPRAVILIDASEHILQPTNLSRNEPMDVQIRQRAQQVIRSVVRFFHLPNDTICAYLGDGEVAVLKASNTKNLAHWAQGNDTPDSLSASWANLAALKRACQGLLRHLSDDVGAPFSVGIGRYHPGVCELKRSYQDARAALSLGRRLHGKNTVHCLDGLGVAAFVGVDDERTKNDLATYLLRPLDQEQELISTLEAFFTENCSASLTANRLMIHRNTLSYRFDKITALSGLDPRRFDDAVQIRLALVMRSLRP